MAHQVQFLRTGVNSCDDWGHVLTAIPIVYSKGKKRNRWKEKKEELSNRWLTSRTREKFYNSKCYKERMRPKYIECMESESVIEFFQMKQEFKEFREDVWHTCKLFSPRRMLVQRFRRAKTNCFERIESFKIFVCLAAAKTKEILCGKCITYYKTTKFRRIQRVKAKVVPKKLRDMSTRKLRVHRNVLSKSEIVPPPTKFMLKMALKFSSFWIAPFLAPMNTRGVLSRADRCLLLASLVRDFYEFFRKFARVISFFH